MTGNVLNFTANKLLKNTVLKPDQRHAALAIALTDKYGNITRVKSGTGTLVGGTATIPDASVHNTSADVSMIHITPNGVTNAGFIGVGTLVDKTSFVVTSSSGTDARTFSYLIINRV